MNMKNFFAPSAWRLGGAVRRAATALLLCVLTMTVQTAWAQSGNWSDFKATSFSSINESVKTIRITTEAELALLAYNTCNGTDYSGYTITLTKDLKMSDHYWDKSIGNSYDNCFRGTFDGGNKTISGINISSGAYKGLFGYVGQSENPGIIQNVTLASSTIIGKAYVGGIVGYLQYGTVSNCHVLSSVSILASADDSNYFGGIVGQTYPNKTVSSATIENCTSAASVTDNGHNNCSNYGGIVGYNYYNDDQHASTVTGCFYYGNAVNASSSAGAIVGSYWYSNGISNCYYNCPSTISGIGYGNTDIGTTRVYKLTLGTGATSLNVSGNATYTHNGIKYYAAGTTATVATTDNTQVILALSATSGTISNLSIVSDKHSATFTIGSSDVTLGGTVKTISGTCGNNGNVTWSLGGTNYTELTISGTGTMQNFEYTTDGIWKTKAPWGTDITKVTIGNGVTSIGNYAFIGCENVASVTIGSGVTSIGIGAINHCDQMTSVTLPASVTTIAYAAFENCQKLETIYINHDGEVSLTSSHDNAFNAPNLQYIIFPSPVGALANTKDSGNWARYSDKLRAQLGNQLFFATNEGGTAAYKIATETDLRNLSTAINGGANGSGQAFRQTAEISVSGNFTPIGSSQTNYFGGTYDGGDKTLTVNISDTQNQGTALFRNIQGATIKNLLLSGSVTGTIHAAALVGFSRGTNTIDRCKVASNVTVTTPSGTNYHCGGLVGHALTSNLTISNTVYCGTITNSGNFVGGLQGWSDGNTVSITNCLFAGSYQGTASFHPIAVRGKSSAATVTASNTYYEAIPSLGDYQYIAADGKKATTATSAPSNLGSLVETLSYMTIYQNGILFNGKYYAAPVLSTDNSGAYLINSAADWTVFCDMLYDNLTYNRFSGKTVKLGADISVSRMAGVDYHDFCGTFDGSTTNGGRHTLTFTATATDNYLAPFCNVLGSTDNHAVISNLNVVTTITATDYRHTAGLMAKAWGYVDVNNCDVTVNITSTKGSNNTDLYPAGITSQVTSGTQLTVSGCTVGGTIETNGKYAAGYVGILQGSASIQNSVSSVNIQSSTSDDGTHGGFVAVVNNGQSLTIEGCLFNGKIVTTNGTTKCGGFVGHDKGTGVTITNSLYAPTADANTVSEGCATFGRNVADANITNSYYTAALGTAQGTAPRSVTAGDQYVTTCTVSPYGSSTATYSVSGITAYNDGLVRNGNFYYGNTDVVSLTLAHQEVPEGYIFDGYTATPESATLSGETNPYSLTMPDANVTIGATFSFLSIAYIDENGQQQFCTEYTVLSEDFHSFLYAGQWYVVKDDIEYYDNFETWGNGAANIILVDGKTCSIFAGYDFRAIKGNVNIYGQSLGTGTLNLTGGDELIDPDGNSYSQSAIFGNIAVYGGIVTANSGEYKELGSDPAILGNVVCRRGKLTANIGDYAIMGNTVDFSGGELTANGIIHSDVTINWTNSSDRFYANSLSNSVTISNGKAFCYTNNTGLHILGPGPDNGDYILSAEEKAAIAGKTLYPAVAVTLSEGITAVSGIIANGDGNYAKVGETVTVSVTAPEGYTLGGITVTPAVTVTDQGSGSYSFTVPAANVSVSAQFDALGSSVAYIDENGVVRYKQPGEFTVLTGTETRLGSSGQETWYVVNSDISYTGTVTLGGDVHLILADGCTLNIGTKDARISSDPCIDGKPFFSGSYHYYSLTIYGQANQSGALNAYSNASYINAVRMKNYTQHGGNVTIDHNNDGIALNVDDDLILTRGTLTATVEGYYYPAIHSGNLTFSGGNLTANGEIHSNATLGWTNPTDFIYAADYSGTVKVASGKMLCDEDGTPYSGTINKDETTDSYPIDGKTLTPAVAVTLADGITATGGIIATGDDNYAKVGATVTVSTSGVSVPEGCTLGGITVTPAVTVTDQGSGSYSFTVPAANVSVSAQFIMAGSVAYVNEKGVVQYKQPGEFTVLTGGGATTLDPGWYVVNSNIDYTGMVSVGRGSVNIILGNGCTMNIGKKDSGISGANGIGGQLISTSALTIYGQSLDDDTAGHLNIYMASGGNYGIRVYGYYTQHSGNVSVTTEGWAMFGICAPNITLNGGSLNVNTKSDNANALYAYNNIVINGGKLDATVEGSKCYALNAGESGGNIMLGWTNASDYIHASSYFLQNGGTVTIAQGKTLYDEDNTPYSGTIEKVNGAFPINGKTLRPLTNVLVLNDDADNTAAISASTGQRNVILQGRKLWKDGAWNTLCLPFSIADIEADGCPLKGATVRELNDASITGTTLTLNFKAATTAIAAGVPYIVKWADGTAGQYTQDPVFTGVTISSTKAGSVTSDDGRVQFLGTYGPTDIYSAAKDNLYLGAGNKLYYPWGEGMTEYYVNAFRAYFHVSGAAGVRQFVLNFDGDGEAQGIKEIDDLPIYDLRFEAGAWYTIDGVKLDGKPTKKGLYIHGDRKVVVK